MSWRRFLGRLGSIPTPEERSRAAATAPIRVALDTRALNHEDATGVGRYVRALLTAFREGHGVAVTTYGERTPRLLGPQVMTPLRMRRDRAQLIHGPANSLPLLFVGLPGVVTIHDLAIYAHPEWFPGDQWFATKVVVPRSVHQARMIICPSEATKAATMRLFGVEAARCRVIPHGVETEFALPASPSVRAEVQTRYALPDRYVLQVGTVQPRKNYITTLRALARIPAPERVPLIVVGGFGWKYGPVVDAVRDLELTGSVRFVGYAGMPDLPALYQMAQAVLFPSLDEGFGLPVLGLPGSRLQERATGRVPFFAEGFADRGYRPDGSLVPRDQPGAFIKDPAAAAAQVRRLIAERGVRTICVHGDNPEAVAFVRAVRAELLKAGAELRPFA